MRHVARDRRRRAAEEAEAVGGELALQHLVVRHRRPGVHLPDPLEPLHRLLRHRGGEAGDGAGDRRDLRLGEFAVARGRGTRLLGHFAGCAVARLSVYATPTPGSGERILLQQASTGSTSLASCTASPISMKLHVSLLLALAAAARAQSWAHPGPPVVALLMQGEGKKSSYVPASCTPRNSTRNSSCAILLRRTRAAQTSSGSRARARASCCCRTTRPTPRSTSSSARSTARSSRAAAATCRRRRSGCTPTPSRRTRRATTSRSGARATASSGYADRGERRPGPRLAL